MVFSDRALRALVTGVTAATVLACGDGVQDVEPSASDLTPLPALDPPIVAAAPLRISVPTYDLSGDAIHPDVVHFRSPWAGWEYWMVFTPYAGTDAALENPSVLVSHDGLRWRPPAGGREPVIPPFRVGEGHNSDPDLLYVPRSDELVMVYREVTGGGDVLKRTSSRDGVSWSTPTELIRARDHSLVSPTVVRRPGRRPLLWVVNAGTGCASTTTQVVLRRWLGSANLAVGGPGDVWSDPVVTDLAQPGYLIWHIDVTYVPSRQELWAIYSARPAGSTTCTAKNDLFVARSRDGEHWQVFAGPVLTHGAAPWSNGTLYRSSMEFDDTRDLMRVWLSAGDGEGSWNLGYAEFAVTPAPVAPPRGRD